MTWPRALLVVLAPCLTVALCVAALAIAGSATISFDDLGAPGPGGPGLAVTSQYLGVTFGNASAFDYSKGAPPIPSFAHSGNVAVEPCAGVEFCSAPLTGGFAAPQRSVKVWVGFSFPLSQPLAVRLTGYNGSTVVGSADATLPANAGPTPIRTSLEVKQAQAVVTRFEVSVTTGGGYTGGLAVDDVEFTDVAPPPPCGATAPPTVALSQPADGSSVYADAFLLAGSVQANGAPITGAAVTAHSAAGDKVAQILPSLVSASGGAFGPTSFGGLLTLGANDVTVSATNCAGTGASAPRRVTRVAPPQVRACQALPEPSDVYVAEDVGKLRAKLDGGFRGRVVFPLDRSWELGGQETIHLQPGVELVGERDALGRRPLLHVGDYTPEILFQVEGPGVCIEGLHLEGPYRGRLAKSRTYAVKVVQDPAVYHSASRLDVVVADNELAGWTGGAVKVEGTTDVSTGATDFMKPEDARRVRVERNYVHHNASNQFGYGVVVGNSAYVTVERNVFDLNRHDVTSSGRPHSGYVARFNYMLESAYSYGYYAPHFDVHGIGPDHYGGFAGEYHLIEHNTIRGEQDYECTLGCQTRAALVIRGFPTKGIFFQHNVLVHDDRGEAFVCKPTQSSTALCERGFGLVQHDNDFDTDHSSKLVAGDFDADGRTDVFLTNGTGWLLSRTGTRPWEFLRPATALRDDLGFADIDNNGATDVLLRSRRGDLGYYPRGASASITPLTKSPVPASDLRFGDFDGDGKTDIFYTRNGRWRIWSGATRAWVDAARSSAPLANLLFGEFDDVKGTDVATVLGNEWSYSSGATKRWARLNKRLRASFSGAVAADFDGNGRTDIAFDDRGTWHFSPDGSRPLQLLRPKNGAVGSLPRLLIGRFEGGTKAMVVAFDPHNRNHFAIWRGLGSAAPFARLSRQAMR